MECKKEEKEFSVEAIWKQIFKEKDEYLILGRYR